MRHILLVLAALAALSVACAAPTTPTVPATPTPEPPDDGATRVLEHEEFSFEYPASWTNRADRYPGFVQPNPEFGTEEPALVSGSGLGFFVGLRSLPEGTDLATLFADTYDRLVARELILKVVAQGETTLDGRAALEITYERFWGEPLVRQRDLWVEKDGRVYIVSCRAHPGRFEEGSESFERLLSSFHLR
ncbi:MAG: hypothetical protein HPY83_02080 [Anaerolineae bacterium]|nr:hypothetical protein [Anaerolineae bacterium]